MRILRFLILVVSFCSVVNSKAQIKMDYGIMVGPNLSTLLQYENGEQLRYFQPAGPFYRFTWHGGVFAETDIHKYFDVRLCLLYQRKGVINGDGPFRDDVFIDYITVPATFLYQPVAEQQFKIEAGLAYEYLFNASESLTSTDDWELSLILGFEYSFNPKWIIGIRWYNTLTYFYDGIAAPGLTLQQRIQAFQLSFMYKIKTNE